MKTFSIEPTSHTYNETINRLSPYNFESTDWAKINEKVENDGSQTKQENTLELMIRAHQRIRTLQEDNQILRMHIQLLAKDNKQLSHKLQRSQIQKNQCMKQNEELQKNIKDLELRFQGLKVKQQLSILQNEKFCKRAKYDKYEQKIYSNTKEVNFSSNEIRKQIKEQQKNQIFQNLSPNATIQKLENNDSKVVCEQQSLLKKVKGLQIQKNFSNFLDKSKIINEEYKKCNKSQQKKIESYFTPNKPYNFEKSQNKFERNLSLKQFSYYDNVNRSAEYRNDRKLSGNSLYSNSYHENYFNKNVQTTTSDFYGNKNTDFRLNSPLIRKNSPGKGKSGACEFHPHKKAPSSFGGSYGADQNLSKKFNYSNWRKTNNNLLVWRLAAGTTHNKPICIDR